MLRGGGAPPPGDRSRRGRPLCGLDCCRLCAGVISRCSGRPSRSVPTHPTLCWARAPVCVSACPTGAMLSCRDVWVVCARGCTEPEWVRAQPERAPRGAREPPSLVNEQGLGGL